METTITDPAAAGHVTTEGCDIHPNHEHQHAEDCEHTAIKHNGHVDYLHDGHLHHMHNGHADEHVIEVSAINPDGCDDGQANPDAAAEQASGHSHGPDCGHEAVPHGDHTDYLVNGRLHHPHEDHCDDHGPVTVVDKP